MDKAFSLILADGRRKPTEEERAAAAALWRRVFRSTPEKVLLDAVEAWLREHPRGRPNIGEVETMIRRQQPVQQQPIRGEIRDLMALRWAVTTLETLQYGGEWASRMNHPNYQHTVDYAQRELGHHGFSHWHDAKAHLEPGWAPSTVTEVYI